MAFLSSLTRWLSRRGRARGGSDEAPARAPDRVVLGLGNPGPEYVDTRHNVGFRVVERLALRHGAIWRDDPGLEARSASFDLAGRHCLLVEPLTFMNRSGRTAAAVAARWPALDPARDLLVVLDDLDLPPGRIRLRAGGGAGGQRGMTDVVAALGTRAVPRLRFGVGRPEARGDAVVDWVLSPFGDVERSAVEPALERAADAVEMALVEGVERAMGRFNARSECQG